MGCKKIHFYIVLMKVLVHLAAPQVCPSGTFLYTVIHTGQHFCIECQDGTFMPYKDHQQTSCIPCAEIEDQELEILVSPCNKTHDAVIHCVGGYYRDLARNPGNTGTCMKCTKCEFVGQPCSTYRDTVCCYDENYAVVPDNAGVPVCRRRPWFCRRGQYFDTRHFMCLRCPINTFMPLDYHIQPECWKCREYYKYDSYRPLHSVINQPCEKTHAPVIRCEDGFFMNAKMSRRGDALGCSPCTDCSSTTDVQYEGRKCDGMEDTVCCPEVNMTVVDTPGGPVCMAHSTRCKDSQCLNYSTKNKSTTCSHCLSSDGSLVKHETTPPPKQVRLTSVEPQCDCSYNGQQNMQGKPHYYEKECAYPLVISVVLAAIAGVMVLIFNFIHIWEPVVRICKKILKLCHVACQCISTLFKKGQHRNDNMQGQDNILMGHQLGSDE